MYYERGFDKYCKKYSKLIKDEIYKLSYYPLRNAIIDNDTVIDLIIRKVIVNNYIIFYRVNENNKTVSIERILYSASNWINEL